MTSESTPGPRRPRGFRWAVAAMLVVMVGPVLLLALIWGAVAIGDPRTRLSPPDNSAVLADMEDRTIDAFLDVADQLKVEGLEPMFANFGYRACNTYAAEQSTRASGRLDQPEGRSSTRADAEAVRDLFADLGWAPTNSDRFTDGIFETSGGWRLHATRLDLAIDSALSQGSPGILVEVFSRCVSVSEDLDHELTFDFAPCRLEIGASSTTTTTTTDPYGNTDPPRPVRLPCDLPVPTVAPTNEGS